MQVKTGTRNRDTLADSMKFILMFLVLWGHLMQEHIDGNRLDATIYVFIYTFHMPLFLFLVGFFTNTQKKWGSYFYTTLQFFVVYLLFATFRGHLKKDLSLEFYLGAGGTLWYLCALIWFRLYIWIFKNVNMYILFIISIFVSLVGGYIQYDELAFQRAATFLPYFMLGYIFRQQRILIQTIPMRTGGVNSCL